MIAVGSVVLFFDCTIGKPKHKRMLCVCAAEGWFLRINSKPHFKPHCPVTALDNPGCLEHDSYVELRGVIDQDLEALEEAFGSGDAKVLGVIGIVSAKNLISAVKGAITLSPIEKRTIVSGLLQMLP